MPFPRTTVIPPAWSAHHQRSATGGMNATVRLDEPADPDDDSGFDTDTGQATEPAGTPRWTGRARIAVAAGEGRIADQADQQVTYRGYLVQLDEAGGSVPDVQVGWHVYVIAAPNDEHLVGREMAVEDVQYGSERFTRDLICNDNLG